MNERRKITVTLNLHPEDLKDLALKAGGHGLTISELLENFIGDLVYSDHTRNGSDECDRARAWFDRCWFGSFPEETLLHHLIKYGDLHRFIETEEAIKSVQEDIIISEKDLQEAQTDQARQTAQEDIEAMKDELQYQTEDLQEIYDFYVSDTREGNPQSLEDGTKAVLEWYENNRDYLEY